MKRLLFSAAVLSFAGCAGSPVADPLRQPINVQAVTVVVSGRSVTAEVRGEFVGCGQALAPSQKRSGDAVTITILEESGSHEVCPMILRLYQQSIPLEGEFTPGDYVLHVNEVTSSFRVR